VANNFNLVPGTPSGGTFLEDITLTDAQAADLGLTGQGMGPGMNVFSVLQVLQATDAFVGKNGIGALDSTINDLYDNSINTPGDIKS
jgi:hypothetical protein